MMQTFALETQIIFGTNALESLKTLGAARVFLVTDRFFEENGTARRIAALCGGETQIFARVQPDPPLTLVAEGVAALNAFRPDTLLALGGGSAIDCAKGILSLSGSGARLVAIPTTSGTGSEVTSFAILTHEGIKHPLIEPQLRPTIAILDDSLLREMPTAIIADAGMDVLAHCLETIAAKDASPFSDALAVHAFQTVLDLLPASFRGEASVRGALHCASTMAGIAFDNAGLGACHALSHALGGTFHLAHGRLNGILLPHVLEHNARMHAEPYARLATLCGLSGARGLRFAVERIRRQLQLPSTLTDAGLSRTDVLAAADDICQAAANDPCAASNPCPVSVEDFRTLLMKAL